MIRDGAGRLARGPFDRTRRPQLSRAGQSARPVALPHLCGLDPELERCQCQLVEPHYLGHGIERRPEWARRLELEALMETRGDLGGLELLLPGIHDLVDHVCLRLRGPREVLFCCAGELVRPAGGFLERGHLIENVRQMALVDGEDLVAPAFQSFERGGDRLACVAAQRRQLAYFGCGHHDLAHLQLVLDREWNSAESGSR